MKEVTEQGDTHADEICNVTVRPSEDTYHLLRSASFCVTGEQNTLYITHYNTFSAKEKHIQAISISHYGFVDSFSSTIPLPITKAYGGVLNLGYPPDIIHFRWGFHGIPQYKHV